MMTQRLCLWTLSDRIQLSAATWCIVLGAILTLAGCNIDEEQEIQEEKRTKPRARVLVDENFKGEIKVFAQPNKYEVHLKWAMNDSPAQWGIHRKEKDQKLELTQVAIVPGTENSLQDRTVEPGKEYTYFLSAVQDSNTLKGKANVFVPRDIEVKGHTAIKGNLKANRLFLRDGSTLLTNGESLNIEINEVLSSFGVIDTSPTPPASAAAGANGRSCGDVSIRTTTASGRLTLQCKAENGVQGANGRNGRDGNKGAQGAPGDVEVKPNDQLPLQVDAIRRSQLKDWYVNDSVPTSQIDKNGWKFWFYCSQAPSDGVAGQSGQNGADGIAGGRGGDTASFIVEVKNESDFQVRTVTSPGEGSVGGRGGNGGKGGSGGLPGKPDPSGFLCPKAKHGPAGPDGLKGRPGPSGGMGVVRPVCIRIGDRIIEGCR